MTEPASLIARVTSHRPHLIPDITVMGIIGLFFGAIGPFSTDHIDMPTRLVYWVTVMVAGGMLLQIAERLLQKTTPEMSGVWRILVCALAITAPQTGVVILAELIIIQNTVSYWLYIRLLPAVFVISVAALSLIHITRFVLSQASGQIDAASLDKAALNTIPDLILQRLPAPLRKARLIALEAEDHYVRIHTDAGSHLLLMRFSDAVTIAESALSGHRLHRSWWATEEAILDISFNRGSGRAQLEGGLNAPVSRTYYPKLREAGCY